LWKIYSATNSMARFYNKNNFSLTYKCSSLLQRWRCSCKFKSRRIGSSWTVLPTRSKMNNLMIKRWLTFAIKKLLVINIRKLPSRNHSNL
jgi:hypothetical protein